MDNDDGLVAVGGDLEPESLLLAYRQGIFPWPILKPPVLAWFCPPKRAVLFFDRLHISRSLAKARKPSPLEITIDQDFEQVIRMCGSLRKKEGTWITPEMRKAYIALHRLDIAHSVEVWAPGTNPEQKRRLVGGVYGVDVDGCFSAESMFHTETNASKLALLHLVDHLKSRGSEWIDVQVQSPHLERLGTIEVPRKDFLSLLDQTQRKARTRNLKLF